MPPFNSATVDWKPCHEKPKPASFQSKLYTELNVSTSPGHSSHPFNKGKKKDNKQEKETLLPNPHTTTPLKDMYIPHNSCFTNHSPSLALWSMPFPHCHTVSFAIREALSSHVGSKCLFLTLWLLQMWHSHAQSLCHPKSPAVKLLGNARRRKASWQHLIMPSNDALGRTG